MLLLWSMNVQFTKTGTSVMVMINMIFARIFMKKWMIHDAHIKPADEDSVDSIPASDAYCLCRGGISELDNKYR